MLLSALSELCLCAVYVPCVSEPPELGLQMLVKPYVGARVQTQTEPLQISQGLRQPSHCSSPKCALFTWVLGFKQRLPQKMLCAVCDDQSQCRLKEGTSVEKMSP